MNTIVSSSSSWCPRPVLADEYERRVELIEVYAADIKDETKTAELVKIVHQCWPLTSLTHLKRVKNCSGGNSTATVLQILLCERSDVDACSSVEQYIAESFQKHSVPEAARWLGKPWLATVSRYTPLTRKQFEESSVFWATIFHEDKKVTKALSGKLFSKEELGRMSRYMALAIAAAKAGKRLEMASVGAAVVVDPGLDQIMAVACDHSSSSDPLQTAVMVAIDLVAQGQGGGVYNLGIQYNGRLNQTLCQELHNESAPVADLRGSVVDKVLVASFKPETPEMEGATPEKNGKSVAEAKLKTKVPYLCTGYDLYTTKEPSVMCSMALVHSRIGRVFYDQPYPAIGGLGSCDKIHVRRNLNHHFEAYCCSADATEMELARKEEFDLLS
eukprot:m.42588 g.42588  ORF g.42588 m.42588 type:complete len:387 (+) comp33367_c0_seq2:43-1203(+)